MEGIKEAIAYITGLAVKAEDPKTVNINGKTYCTKDLVRYDAPEKAAPISATTLTSLVDYIKENREELRDRMIIQVVNETKVLLYSGLLAERDRETLFEVNALLPRFEYGREYDQESFLISMQSCFKESDDREAVTMLASNIVNTQEATFSDNGTTQQAVMKTGITTKDNVLVPNPVNLIPYRTFLEVEQPASDFVFRVSEGRGGAPVFKLVAADGGVWKSQAVANVKAYLTEALKDIPDRDKITIIRGYLQQIQRARDRSFWSSGTRRKPEGRRLSGEIKENARNHTDKDEGQPSGDTDQRHGLHNQR